MTSIAFGSPARAPRNGRTPRQLSRSRQPGSPAALSESQELAYVVAALADTETPDVIRQRLTYAFDGPAVASDETAKNNFGRNIFSSCCRTTFGALSLVGYNWDVDLPPVTYVTPEVVLLAWLDPRPACHAPAPARAPIKLPDSWMVVAATATNVNSWVGDMPILADGHYTCAMVELIRIDATTPFFVRG